MNNNLFWDNKKGGSATAVGADYSASGFNTSIFNNNLWQLASGNYPSIAGSIFQQDPKFVDAAANNLRLQAGSPAINAGLNTGLPVGVVIPAMDILGNTRILGSAVDMGAHESFDLSIYSAVTGLSQAVVADGQYTDASNWTHYVNSAANKILLSIKKNGNDIGTLGDGTFAVENFTTPTWGAATAASTSAPYVSNSGWKVMNRWWNVTPKTQPTSDVQVRSYFTPADIAGLRVATGDAGLTNTQLKFYKINGAGNNPNPALGHAGIPAAATYSADGYWQYDNAASASTNTWLLGTQGSDFYAEMSVASFSGGGGGGGAGGAGAFPVEWLEVEATLLNNQAVQLTWTTASERNVSHFDIERSADGEAFVTVGSTPAVGNSTEIQAYKAMDNQPLTSRNFYRIKSIDLDGAVSYSQRVELAVAADAAVRVYPNPAKEVLTFEITQTGINSEMIVLYDALGHEVYVVETRLIASLQQHIPISQLPAGIYTWYVVTDNKVHTGKVVKQ